MFNRERRIIKNIDRLMILKGMDSKATLMIYFVIAIILPHLVHTRDPETVKKHSLDQCSPLGIYRVEDQEPWWCCNCPAGSHKYSNCRFGMPTSTVCRRCPFDRKDSNNQTHSTSPNNSTECMKSINESYCKNLQNSHWVGGSRTEPSFCECDDGYYAKPDRIMKYGCNRRSPCEKGYEPVETYSKLSDTDCKRCPPGTYSNVSSATEMCKIHSVCEPDEIRTPGNFTSDTQCDSKDKANEITDRGAFPNWGIVVLVLLLLTFGGIALCYYYWTHGCCCNAQVEDIKSGDSNIVNMSNHTIVHMNDSFTESDGSSKPLMSRDDEICDDKGTSEIERLIDKGHEVLLQTAQPAEASPVEVVIVRETPVEERTIIDDVLDFLKCRPNIDKDVNLPSYRGWKDVIKGLFTDPEIGAKIIFSWKDTPKEDLRRVVRKFLKEVDIKDIEDDHSGSAKEIRYQWLLAISRTVGCRMTPEYLLSHHYEQTCFKDSIVEALIKEAIAKLCQDDPSEQL